MIADLPGWVAEQARRRASEPAVISLGPAHSSVWDWGRLWRESQRIAALLRRCGVRPGENVGYQLPNRGEFVSVTLGILSAGAVCCPLMPIFRERELRYMLGRARVRVLVVMDRYRGRRPAEESAAVVAHLSALKEVLVVGAGEGELPRGTRARFRWLEEAAQADAAPAIEAMGAGPEALAQLLFTSGTSGEPKGVLHRGDVLARAALLQARHLRLGEADRIFVPSPLAHQTGFLYGMWLALCLGAPQILLESWDPVRALAGLAEWQGSFVQAATPFLADLTQAVEEGTPPPRSLRIFIATGTAVPRALAGRASGLLSTSVCGAFGTTEGCLAALGSPDDPPQKASGTDGRALQGVRLRICDEAGHELPAGREGHFQTCSPTMFEGYLEHPEWTAAAFTADGWYRTGDLAMLDGEGYLHVTGRVKDVVNRGGEKVPVAEIEQLLHEHASVREVAIVAMPDARLGERACAFVVARGPGRFDLPALQSFLDERRVAKPYWPERLELVAELPKTPSGKIQKYLLREWAKTFNGGNA